MQSEPTCFSFPTTIDLHRHTKLLGGKAHSRTSAPRFERSVFFITRSVSEGISRLARFLADASAMISWKNVNVVTSKNPRSREGLCFAWLY